MSQPCCNCKLCAFWIEEKNNLSLLLSSFLLSPQGHLLDHLGLHDPPAHLLLVRRDLPRLGHRLYLLDLQIRLDMVS